MEPSGFALAPDRAATALSGAASAYGRMQRTLPKIGALYPNQLPQDGRDCVVAYWSKATHRDGVVNLEGRNHSMHWPHSERVLLSGATGTLGYNIVQHLGAKHPETHVHLLMRELDPSLFEKLANVDCQLLDITNSRELTQSVLDFQPNAIIHCAASGVRPSRIGWFDLIRLNVSASVALFEASCEVDRCHFIRISTGLVYGEQDRPCHEGDPIDTLHPYGASKAAADCLLRAGALCPEGRRQEARHSEACIGD
jgi:hypothetical protein